jgi:hypothetical protein
MKVISNGKDNIGICKVKVNGNDAYLYKQGGGFKVVRVDGLEITPDEPGETSCPHSNHCRNKIKFDKCTLCMRNERDPRTKDYFIPGEIADIPEENKEPK